MSVYWNGIEYSSYEEAAKAQDPEISRQTMWARINTYGYTCDDDMPGKSTGFRKREGKACRWNGELYSSVSAAARAQGISYPAMCYRLRLGYESDEDMKFVRDNN